MASKKHSPYTSSFLSCVYLQDEFDRMLPLLLSDDSEALVKQELEQNALMQINSLVTRKHAMNEILKRFKSSPKEFWEVYQDITGVGHRLAYFYAILRTYRILFDLHLNVTVKRWMATEDTLTQESLRQELGEIAANDEFVGSWSDVTMRKIQTAYQSILRKVGFLEGLDEHLHQPSLYAEDFRYYIENGEGWFLDACLLRQYEIARIRSELQ